MGARARSDDDGPARPEGVRPGDKLEQTADESQRRRALEWRCARTTIVRSFHRIACSDAMEGSYDGGASTAPFERTTTLALVGGLLELVARPDSLRPRRAVVVAPRPCAHACAAPGSSTSRSC